MKAILIRPLPKGRFIKGYSFTFMKIYNFIKYDQHPDALEQYAHKYIWISIGDNVNPEIKITWMEKDFNRYWKILEP